MSKKKDGYVLISKKDYEDLLLAVAYAIIRSDQAYISTLKINKSLKNYIK